MVDVVYIAGWGRSGSTLLARILGEHPSMTFVGEVRGTFLRGLVENRICGCGAPFADCSFWQAVGQEAFGGWDRAPVEEALRLRDQVDKPWMVTAYRDGRSGWPLTEHVDRYVEIFDRLLRAIGSVVGPDQVVIDSSKIPSFAWLTSRADGVSLRTIHLVRDARGSVYSWQKRIARRDTPDGTRPEMLRYAVTGASYRYVGYNLQAEALRGAAVRHETHGSHGPRSSHVFVRYEDLVAAPALQLDRIAAEIDLPGWRAGQVDGTRVRLGPSHSVVGNPMRLDTGWLPLRRDDAWRTQMPLRTRRFVTAVTATALVRYGYPLAVPAPGHTA